MNEIEILRKANISLEHGLSEEEFLLIERQFDIKFPPDLKRMLEVVLPVSKGFPNWRNAIISTSADFAKIKQRLNDPLDGLLFDVENNNIWYEPWGTKPADIQMRKSLVKSQFSSYPKLIPVFQHRYIPPTPMLMGNPIFSVWQTDIIYYGVNLHHYLKNEFEQITAPSETPIRIDFWDHWVEGSSCW